MLHLVRLSLSILLLWGCTDLAAAEKRVALVIGNSAYSDVPYLWRPGRDARAIAIELERLGFDSVDLANDRTADAMQRKLFEFEKTASDADIAVIYFAGHGIEVDGTNYLLPTDAQNLSTATIQSQAVSLDTVLATLVGARKLKLVLLDACHDNPYVPKMRLAGRGRSVVRGLGRVEPSARQTAIAAAACEGAIAAGADHEHSPFTRALLRHLSEPLDIRRVLGQVREDVIQQSKGQQEPFLNASLSGRPVVLAPAGRAPAATIAPKIATPIADMHAPKRVKTMIIRFDDPAPGWPGLRQAPRQGR
jgi:uncharacterized caspase-like protein